MSTHVRFSERWVVSILDEGNGWYANAEFGTDTTPVVSPDTVTRGVPFPVKIYTFSGGCTQATDSVNVTMNGSTVLLIPFDHFNRPLREAVACPAVLWADVRTVRLTLTLPGPATIEVRGWRTGDPSGSTLITLTKSVVVNP